MCENIKDHISKVLILPVLSMGNHLTTTLNVDLTSPMLALSM